jgi:spermidine/putrescine-binding protein
MNQLANRRQFLASAASLGAGALLASRGSSSSAATTAAAQRPPLAKEPGDLSLFEWQGYEAGGTTAQTSGLKAGSNYIAKYGKNSVKYTYMQNNDQALNKIRSGATFDIMHPCSNYLPEWIATGAIQPWDTSLLPSFKNFYPQLIETGKIGGKQYLIPWDWGHISLIYRTDKISPQDAKGWELAWNKKYAHSIALYDSVPAQFESAALVLGYPNIDHLTSAQVTAAKNKLLEQKPLVKFYWDAEYGQLQPALKSGDVWIANGYDADYVAMLSKGIPVAYMRPSQGRLGWVCGFVLSKETKNYYHAHQYVESFINHQACVQMTNDFYYGTPDRTITAAEITNKALAKQLGIGNPSALRGPGIHLQSWEPNISTLELAWEEVKAS